MQEQGGEDAHRGDCEQSTGLGVWKQKMGARVEWALPRHKRWWENGSGTSLVPSGERTQAPGLPAKVTDGQIHSGSDALSHAPVNPVGFGLAPGGASEPRGLRHTGEVAEACLGACSRAAAVKVWPGAGSITVTWELVRMRTLLRSPGRPSNGSEALRLIPTNAENPA